MDLILNFIFLHCGNLEAFGLSFYFTKTLASGKQGINKKQQEQAGAQFKKNTSKNLISESCSNGLPLPFKTASSVTIEAGSDPRGHLGVTWSVYLCAGKPPLADIILSHYSELTRCDSVIGLAIPATSGHIQYRGAAS